MFLSLKLPTRQYNHWEIHFASDWLAPMAVENCLWYFNSNMCPGMSLNNFVSLCGNIIWRLLVPSGLLNQLRKVSFNNIAMDFKTCYQEKSINVLCIFIFSCIGQAQLLVIMRNNSKQISPSSYRRFCLLVYLFNQKKNGFHGPLSVAKFTLTSEQWPNCWH